MAKKIVKAESSAPEVKKVEEAVEKQDKVKIKIPKLRDRQDEYVPVGINGFIQYIPVCESVEVPEQVAELLENAGYI